MAFMKRRRSFSGRPGSSKRMRYTRRTRWSRRPAYRARRRYSGRRAVRPRSSRVIKSLNLHGVGMPQVLITQMTYRDYGNLAGNAQVAYRLNDMTNPRTGVPHQPRFFDQFLNGTWYSRYTVYRADVEVRFRNRQSEDAMVATLAEGSDTTFPETVTPAALFLMGELPYLNSKVLTNKDEGGPDHTWTYKASFRPNKLLGVTKATLYADDAFSGSTASQPNRTANFLLAAADNPQDSGAVSVDYEIYIKYFVKLYANQHDAAPSTTV